MKNLTKVCLMFNRWDPLTLAPDLYTYQMLTRSSSSMGAGTQAPTPSEEDLKSREPASGQKKVTPFKFNPFAKEFVLPNTSEADEKTLSSTPRQTLITATPPLVSSSSSVSTTAIGIFSAKPVERGLVPINVQTTAPEASYHVPLHTKSLEDEVLYGIYVSTSRSGEPYSFDYSNVILFEFQTKRKQIMYGSKSLNYQLNTGMPIWLEETNGTKPMLLYKSLEVGKKILQDNPHAILDNRRKLRLSWPIESGLSVNYEIWKLDSNLQKDERVYSSQDGIIFNHLYNVPFDAFLGLETINSQFESKPGVRGDLFEAEIGYKFNDPNLLDLVLNHNLIRECVGSNFEQERLEFLGNAILDLIIIKYWYADPRLTTDHWVGAIQDLIENKHGIQYITQLGILKHVKLTRPKASMLGTEDAPPKKGYMDLFEVLIGAIYLDSDFDGVEKFYQKHFGTHVQETLQRAIEEVASSKQDDTSESDPLIRRSASKHVPVMPSKETFEEFVAPSQQKLGYKFKNAKIVQEIGLQWQTNKQFENLIFNSVDHEFINESISEWEKNKKAQLFNTTVSDLIISKWRDRTSCDLIPKWTTHTLASKSLDDETRKTIIKFVKFLTLSKYLEQRLFDIFLFKRFPEVGVDFLTLNRYKQLLSTISSIPYEIVGAIFLDGGMQSIQPLLDTWYTSATEQVVVDDAQIKKKNRSRIPMISGVRAFVVEELAAKRAEMASEDDKMVSTFADPNLEEAEIGPQVITNLYEHAILIKKQPILKELRQRDIKSFKAVVALSDHEIGIGISNTRLKAISVACFNLINQTPELQNQLKLADPAKTLESLLEKRIIAGYQLQFKKTDDHSMMLRVIINLNDHNIYLSDKCKSRDCQLKLKEMAQEALSILNSSPSKGNVHRRQIRIAEFPEDSADDTTQDQEDLLWKQDLLSILTWQKSWAPFYNTYEVRGGFRSIVYAGENQDGDSFIAIGHGTTKKAAELQATRKMMLTIPQSVIEEYKLYKQMSKKRGPKTAEGLIHE